MKRFIRANQMTHKIAYAFKFTPAFLQASYCQMGEGAKIALGITKTYDKDAEEYTMC